jgi:hypothetical protein
MSSSPHASPDLYVGQGLRLDGAVPLATVAEPAGFGGLWTL